MEGEREDGSVLRCSVDGVIFVASWSGKLDGLSMVIFSNGIIEWLLFGIQLVIAWLLFQCVGDRCCITFL